MLMTRQQLEQQIKQCEFELKEAEQKFDSDQIVQCRQRLIAYSKRLTCGWFFDEINERGNGVDRSFYVFRERDYYDYKLLLEGWHHYGTTQDAPYFGIWVHVEDRQIITFAEGDETHVTCLTEECFLAELKNMDEFYGSDFLSAMVGDAIGSAPA